MSTIRFRFVLLCISLFMLISCSNDDETKISYGTTTGDYFPLAENNEWRYYNGNAESVVALGTTTTFNDTPYFTVFDSDVTINVATYMAKRGASYLQKSGESLQPLPNGGTVSISSFEIVMFRDDLEVGETWNGTPALKVKVHNGGPAQNVPASLSYTGTILARDVTEIIDGTTYTDVIKMQLHAVQEVNSQVTNIDAEYWFAKDVGIIKESSISTTDNVLHSRYLTSYILQ